MSIDWLTLKTYIRESVIKDVVTTTSNNPQFTDAQLLVAARWACVNLSMHTAQANTWHYPCDGIAYKFRLVDSMVDSSEKAALVIHNDGTNYEYLAPVRATPSIIWPSAPPSNSSSSLRAYFEWPQGWLVLTYIPDKNNEIIVHGFNIWNPPIDDSSILDFPMQFEQPFSYIVGALLFDPLGAQASAIRTWNTKNDSGTPEDNSLQTQSKYFWSMARDRLRDIGPQDRETYYKLAPRSLGFQR